MMKKISSALLALITCLALFTGCGNSVSSASADLSYTQADVENIPISSDVKVVGLGEASHGVAQYHQMKADVFKSLVKSNDCRTFIIEGDFVGALKVDNYINGGDGSAEEAACEIGFAIYRTQEMADLIEWMRSYNETVSPEKALHFYGMDMQRFDNNKEYLFSVLSQTVPELSAEYTESFAQLTDENRNSLDKATLNSAKEAALELIEKMDNAEADIVALSGEVAFDFASAQSDETWKQILTSKQTITTLNVGLSGALKKVKAAYTTTVTPQSTFDGMIVFRTVTPTTFIE